MLKQIWYEIFYLRFWNAIYAGSDSLRSLLITHSALLCKTFGRLQLFLQFVKWFILVTLTDSFWQTVSVLENKQFPSDAGGRISLWLSNTDSSSVHKTLNSQLLYSPIFQVKSELVADSNERSDIHVPPFNLSCYWREYIKSSLTTNNNWTFLCANSGFAPVIVE